VLISGVNGFTGIHLAKFLKAMHFNIHGLDMVQPETIDPGHAKNMDQFYLGDVRDGRYLTEIVQSVKPDFLFHLAGLIESDKLEDLHDVNVQGTKNILDAARGMKTRIMIPGSAAEYGAVPVEKQPIGEDAPLCPVTFYGISKVCQTLIGRCYHYAHDSTALIARPFNIIGPGAPSRLVCSSLARQIASIKKELQEPVINLGDQDSIRDFVDIKDVVKAYWAIADRGIPGEIYNVCSGKGMSIGEIVHTFRDVTGVRFEIRQDQGLIKKSDIRMSVGDHKKITTQTGWRPEISLADSLRSMVDFYL
jgi:GDP-4-dehydro-6-deoxy-D-mannose reductase